jgi:hypothetical protein
MEEYSRVPLQYRKLAHLPSAGTAEYPCEHSEYPMGVPRVPCSTVSRRTSRPPVRASDGRFEPSTLSLRIAGFAATTIGVL